MTGYTFGDTDLAAERLRILDAVFAPTTDALFDDLDHDPSRIADLGCGPGATTARLVKRFPRAEVVGVDTSPTFIETASRTAPSALFERADVSNPLPRPPYDLIYARFLLAHLPDVGAALEVWSDALETEGVLVLEETGTITTQDPDFSRYEELTRARVATTGASVYAGLLIGPQLPLDLEIVVDRLISLDLTAGHAAAMFWRNLATWGPAAVADGDLSDGERADLLARLRSREHDDTRGLFTWTHQQLIVKTKRH